MRLIKAMLAGFFVLLVGFFTAVVIAVSALVVFVGQRWRSRALAKARGVRAPGNEPVRRAAGGDVIDVEATEVPVSSAGR